MAESTGQHALGFKLETSSDDVTYTTIAEVVDANFGGWQVQAAKATHHDSPDNMTEAKPGIGQSKPYTATINVTQAQYAALDGYFRSSRWWRVSFPLKSGETTPERIKVKAFLSDFGQIKFDPEDTQVMVTTIELTRVQGKPVHTNGS